VPVDAEMAPSFSGDSRIVPARLHVRAMWIAQIRSCIRPSLPHSSQSPTNTTILDAWNVLAYGIRAATHSTNCGDGLLEQASEQNAVVRGH
jgi:hypothetical protein